MRSVRCAICATRGSDELYLPIRRGANHAQLRNVREERLDFFEVALVCPAAPKIGCGGRAKPALRALLGHHRIEAAWLNESGTRIAIAWRNASERLSLDDLDDLLTPHGLSVRAIGRDARDGLLAAAKSTRWYDSESVDELSDREAAIIGARFVSRIAARTPLTEQQRSQLSRAISDVFRARFRGERHGDIGDLLREAVKAYVDGAVARALDDAIALGHRPVEGEE